MLSPHSNQRTPLLQGLLNKKPSDRLGWPELLEHPFVRDTSEERLQREKATADAVEVADSSRAWRVRGGEAEGGFQCARFQRRGWRGGGIRPKGGRVLTFVSFTNLSCPLCSLPPHRVRAVQWLVQYWPLQAPVLADALRHPAHRPPRCVCVGRGETWTPGGRHTLAPYAHWHLPVYVACVRALVLLSILPRHTELTSTL